MPCADLTGGGTAVTLNHTIVYAEDREASAQFLSEVLGLAAPEPFGPFLVVRTANGASLDYYTNGRPVAHGHCAFEVSEPEFDAIFGRLQQRGSAYWAVTLVRGKGRSITTMAGTASISAIPPAI